MNDLQFFLLCRERASSEGCVNVEHHAKASLLRGAMAHAKDNQRNAAACLGVSIRNVSHRLKRLGERPIDVRRRVRGAA